MSTLRTKPCHFASALRVATFRHRPNRFAAEIDIDGRPTTAHINSGGRMQELLTPGRTVAVAAATNTTRKTPWDLKLVRVAGKWMSIDSMLANRLVARWLERRELPEFKDYREIKREVRVGDSRFDFQLTGGKRPVLIEVKNVTLNVGNWGVFPDAPSTRGARHVRELAALARDGMSCAVVWIMAHPRMRRCWAHPINDPEFTQAVIEARDAGVTLLAFQVHVTLRCATGIRPCPVEPLDDDGLRLLRRHVSRYAKQPLTYTAGERRRRLSDHGPA